MLAVVDAKYNFTVIDFGGYWHECDDELFSNSNFGRMMLEGPDPVLLPNTEIAVHHVFVVDEDFPLKPNLMRLYPGMS